MTRILRVADQLGIQTYPVHSAGLNVSHVNGKTKTYRGTVPPASPLVLLDVNAVLRKCEQLAARLNVKHPTSDPKLAQLDLITVSEWLKTMTWCEATKTLIRGAIQTVLAVEPEEVSMLAWLTYIKSAGMTRFQRW